MEGLDASDEIGTLQVFDVSVHRLEVDAETARDHGGVPRLAMYRGEHAHQATGRRGCCWKPPVGKIALGRADPDSPIATWGSSRDAGRHRRDSHPCSRAAAVEPLCRVHSTGRGVELWAKAGRPAKDSGDLAHRRGGNRPEKQEAAGAPAVGIDRPPQARKHLGPGLGLVQHDEPGAPHPLLPLEIEAEPVGLELEVEVVAPKRSGDSGREGGLPSTGVDPGAQRPGSSSASCGRDSPSVCGNRHHL